MKKMTKIYFVLFFLMIAVMPVFAQVTSSGMSGKVTNVNNESLPGATVLAIHQPSGTQYGTITNVDGRYIILGMRPGGPYTVEVSFVGYNKETFTEITLSLGESFELNTSLKESTVDVGEVMVVGARGSKLNKEKTGAVTNISGREIQNLPSISRSLTDFTKLSPMAGAGNSFGGRDGRYNNITIDGANLNNNFGLSTDPMPGGGNPISLDAIEEVSVSITPFDVRQANFTGAGISAITKSGDNTIKGSAYGYYRDQDFNGRKVGDQELPEFQKTSTKVYGARIGGPIIKNKLFYFVSAEKEVKEFPGISYRPAQAGLTGTNVSSTPIDSLKKLSDYLIKTYNYNPGAYDNFPNFESENTKFLVKIDWNINDKHKLTVKYSDMKGSNDVQVNNTSIPGGGISPVMSRLGNNRFGNKSMAFENSNYGFKDIVRSATAELNSKIKPNLTNQFLATYTKIQSTRTFKGGVFPTIDFLNLSATAALNNQNYMHVGMDPFTNNNDVINNIYSFIDNITYSLGNHTITGGISYEHQRVGNMFMAASNSYYIFRSLNDFMTNKAPAYYAYTYSLVEGKPAVYSAELKLGQLGIYLQDEFKVKNNLKLTYGLRVDRPIYDDQPISNPAVAALTFKDKDGNNTNYSTGTWPKATWYWSPRVGFRWDVFNNKDFIVRGGTGLYTGRIPFVFLTNIPTNSAMYQVTAAVTKTADLANYKFNPNPDTYAANFPKTAGTSIVSNSNFVFTNPNFKFPQIWRTSLGLDKDLGGGFTATLEAVYTKDINAVYMFNANLSAPDATVVGADTRPRWKGTNKVNSNIGSAIVLENTNKGNALSLTAQITKSFSNGWFGSLSYTYTDAQSVTGNPGSQATSVWNSNPNSSTANAVEMAYSQYATPNRIVGNVSYKLDYTKFMATTLTLTYMGYDDIFSYVYSSDLNGDGNGYDLIYIPKNQDEILFTNATINNVTYTPQQQWDILNTYIENDPYLKKHRGEYAERNGGKLPFYHNIDAKIVQDFYFNVAGHKNTLQVSLDILNLPNLLNKNWGIRQTTVQRNLLVPKGYTTDGKPQFNINSSNNAPVTESFQDVVSTSSTWGMQLGVRYIF